jgi:hypothetical protein
VQATFGALARFGSVRVAILPELTSSPWHAGAQSVDLPIRFGESPLRRRGPGQSSIIVRAGPMELGAATENEW